MGTEGVLTGFGIVREMSDNFTVSGKWSTQVDYGQVS